MKFLFRKRKAGKVKEAEAPSGLVLRIHGLQKKWAVKMQNYSERLSRKGKVMVLSGFVLVMTTSSLYSISKLFYHTGNGFSFKVGNIRKPMLQQRLTVPLTTDKELARIRRFKFFMDSLARSPSGKWFRDSVLRYRPGLMDSINSVESYYAPGPSEDTISK